MLRSDTVLEHEVAAELACDLSCKTAGIAVSVRHGIVSLTGTVANRDLRQAAVRAVKRVFGVDGVHDGLEVGVGLPASATAAVVRSEASA